MAERISVPDIQGGLNTFSEGTSTCQSIMSNINSGYVEGTQAEWSSPNADTWITSFSSAFNDYISQWNTKYNEGANTFVEAANALLTHENANTVNVDVQTIAEFSKSWTGDPDNFNVPNDYAGFTTNNLDTPLQQMMTTLDEMQGGIQRAVSGGLDGSYCTNVMQSLNDLKQSAQEVASEYNSTAAANATNEDAYLASARANS